MGKIAIVKKKTELCATHKEQRSECVLPQTNNQNCAVGLTKNKDQNVFFHDNQNYSRLPKNNNPQDPDAEPPKTLREIEEEKQAEKKAQQKKVKIIDGDHP